MPCYCYKCDVCGMACDEFRRMADRNDPFVCECKDGMMKRDIASERPHVRRTEDYSHPIHSDSLAISPSQVAEHKKMFPNIKLDSECRPIFDNYVEHDKYLKTCGFDKKEQRIKPKGKRIDKPKQPSKRGLPLKEI